MRSFLYPILLLAAVFIGDVAVSAQSDDDDVIRVDSSIVVMNVSLRDADNKPVVGLDQSKFRIFEDGVEQQTDSFESQESPFSAVILFDTSGSMRERIGLARSATIRFLDGLSGMDTAAIYRFDSKVAMVQDFSSSRDVSEHIFDLAADGETVLNDAVYEAAMLLDKRPEKRRAIIVLSDGADSMSKHSADRALRAALDANATIYTVDMSRMYVNNPTIQAQGRGVLKTFAEKTGGVFISTLDGFALRDALQQVIDDLHIQYTLAYVPKNTKKDGKWHAIEVRVARPHLTIRTRKGYNAPKGK